MNNELNFIPNDLCAISSDYGDGIKLLDKKITELRASRKSIDIRDKQILSSMKADMIKTKREIDEHISLVYLRNLSKIDGAYERKIIMKFLELIDDSGVSMSEIYNYAKLSPTEVKVLDKYFRTRDLNSIDISYGWSVGVSYKYYISGMYHLRKFFIDDFEKIYDQSIRTLSSKEIATLKKIRSLREKVVSAETFDQREIKLNSLDKLRVGLKEEEFLTLYRVICGESFTEIEKDYDWPSGYAYRYHDRACKKINGHKAYELESKDDVIDPIIFLSDLELTVHKMIIQGKKGSEIARSLGCTLEAVKSTRKRIKRKLNS